MLVDTKNNLPTRVGFRFLEGDGGKITGKVRIAKRSGEII
jgi:hypothetical protein